MEKAKKQRVSCGVCGKRTSNGDTCALCEKKKCAIGTDGHTRDYHSMVAWKATGKRGERVALDRDATAAFISGVGVLRTARLYGMELEVEKSSDMIENGETPLAHDSGIEAFPFIAHVTRDGSLDAGHEYVSHPCTYEKLKEEMPSFLHFLRESGYRSHDTTTCGLHWHIQRQRGDSNTWTIASLAVFFDCLGRLRIPNTEISYLRKITRRTQSSLERYANPYMSLDTMHSALVDKRYNNSIRYSAVNVGRDSTVEIRVFRGSLLLETVLASLQFCVVAWDFCEKHDPETIQKKYDTKTLWGDFVESIHKQKYKELISYMKSLRLV